MEHEIDGWVEQLSQCKQLTEADVKRLCDKVSPWPITKPVDHFSHAVDLTMLAGNTDSGDLNGGVECSACKMSRHRVRRYPWSIRMCCAV